MCNFAPGECLAIAAGSEQDIRHRLDKWDFPGRWELIPLLPAKLDVLSDRRWPFEHQFMVHMTDIPDGLETLAVSKLSAALGDLIGQHRAVVELNLYLPLAAQVAGRRADQLSSHARQTATQLRMTIQEQLPLTGPRRAIGLLDTGIAFSSFSSRRRFSARDYVGSRQSFGQDLSEDHDLQGHGTQVCRILDESLPDDVPIVSGRIAAAAQTGITVLRVASAYAHMAAADDPAVINLSIAPRDDELVCPRCRRAVAVEAFHSLILPYVLRLAEHRTLTVMAAGNRGQISNARHALAATSGLALVEAAASSGEIAPYSNRVDVNYVGVARSFGGDTVEQLGSIPVFDNVRSAFGTSFAAPFVSAAAYAYQGAHLSKYGIAASFGAAIPGAEDFGAFCKSTLGDAITFRTATLAPEDLAAARK